MPINDTGLAAVQQPTPKSPPVLTPGDLTPVILRKWYHACRVYAMHKELDADKQVSRVAWGMQDDRLADWYHNPEAYHRIDQLTLDAYIAEMKSLYLRDDWEDDLREEILKSAQGTELFWNWVNRIQSTNSLLKGTKSHLTDQSLRFHFEAHMNSETKRYCKKDTRELKALAFKLWINTVRLLDEERAHDKWSQNDAIADAVHRQGQRNILRPPVVTSSTSMTTYTSRPSTTFGDNKPRLPGLTDSERALLMKYSGCFNCRKFGVNHRRATCTERPDPFKYKPLTEADVPAHLKASGSGPRQSFYTTGCSCQHLRRRRR
ncbi:hypothetical protein GLOTRDRAFT_37381 [Gloeophyllum trabeum ATCC 11539]|uniref:Retrotransposon gag domain-containing protein n=1 Tax=Gloeophyllum trabeum (strain ATCC 11539 / FP-39264 / Madison 617) TaxID=670483 RepID=S7RX53_GLOTA|nr:uncharacterized protein GLOTRDRAFT_37381 [Gloeophyllum trabeum ATCC 11539]EPQ57924.1 hypothetical protein GLOTRDRAFT_37381 [Gloeophyllum trabeum ATCC 11539]